MSEQEFVQALEGLIEKGLIEAFRDEEEELRIRLTGRPGDEDEEEEEEAVPAHAQRAEVTA
jgi:hypothetical protein